MLAPLVGAVVAGFGGRIIGRAGAHTVTIAGVLVATIASFVILGDVLKGNTFDGTIYTWAVVGGLKLEVGLPDRLADRDDDGGRDLRLADGPHLHDRLHGRRPGLPALLLVHLALHLQHADAGDEQQLPAALLRLGSGGTRVLPADRLLVQAPDGDLRQPEGVPGQPRRRLRLRARASASSSRTSARCTTPRSSPAAPGMAGDPDRVAARHAVAAADGGLHLPLHRRHGQERAVSAARVAAGFDGGPDADLGADPRGDDGDRRHLHGGAHVAAVRAVGRRAVVRHRHRGDHRVLHGTARHRAERHQAGRRVLDAVAAGLHDGGAGRRPRIRWRSST